MCQMQIAVPDSGWVDGLGQELPFPWIQCCQVGLKASLNDLDHPTIAATLAWMMLEIQIWDTL